MADTTSKDVVRLEQRIRMVRGVQVIVDADLAEIYGVPTRALNQAVRRNLGRFPADFAFQLARSEMVNLRSQIVISSSGHGGRRHSAWAFAEHDPSAKLARYFQPVTRYRSDAGTRVVEYA